LKENSHIDLQFEGNRPGSGVEIGLRKLFSEDRFRRLRTLQKNLRYVPPHAQGRQLASMTDSAVFVAGSLLQKMLQKLPAPKATSCEPAASFLHHCLQTIEAKVQFG